MNEAKRACQFFNLEKQIVCNHEATKLIKLWNIKEFPCCDEHIKELKKESSFQYVRALVELNGKKIPQPK